MIYIVILLAVFNIFLVIKVYDLRSAALKIEQGFHRIVNEDTNNVITLNTRDGRMRNLAIKINTELKTLRREKNRYIHGNVELSNAITNISHDLRTPLTAIIGYLDMIRKSDDKEKMERYLPIVSERVESMKQLTEELFDYSLDFSNIGTEVVKEEVDINRVLEDSIMGYYGVLTEKNIELKAEITEKKIVRMLNRNYMSRIFSNLLNNAVKYSDGDLKIVLDDDGTITFSNSAEGLKGIDVEQLFDRFYTVEAARNSTGLGLSIVKLLVERQGGSISSEYVNGILNIRIDFP